MSESSSRRPPDRLVLSNRARPRYRYRLSFSFCSYPQPEIKGIKRLKPARHETRKR
jgi:hypothetical protein